MQKREVSMTSIAGVVEIKVVKREQIWLSDVKYKSHDLYLLTRPS